MAAARGRRHGLPRARRITRSADIRAMFRRGKRSRTVHLDVLDAASPVPYPRAGVVVPRYGHRIVDRNVVKRRLREVLRRDVLPWLSDRGLAVDVLVRARRGAYGVSYATLREELVGWMKTRWSRASC